MDKLKTYPNITGDDYPFTTIQLKYVPEEYTFKGLTFPTDKPLTLVVKDKLVDFATRYYRNHEIVGSSVADFFDNLQVDLDMNIDTFEKMMEVYNEDIAKPTQSREIKRTYDLEDSDIGSETNTSESTSSSNGESTNYDIPLDNGTAQGTDKNVSSNSGSSTGSGTTQRNNTLKKTGTETEYWSDVGVAPNYELLNGFLDNNRTLYEVFVSFFKTDFQITEVYRDGGYRAL